MAYVAIETRYIPASNTRGSRVKATAMEAKPKDYEVPGYQRPPLRFRSRQRESVSRAWDSDIEPFRNHLRAAQELLPELTSDGGVFTLIPGSTDRGYVFTVLRTTDGQNPPQPFN